MIKEDYVNFEIAKLLRDKGFDEITFTWYNKKGKFCVGKNNFDDYYMNHFSNIAITDNDKNKCSAPTIQRTVRWLKEKYNILLVVDYEYECDTTPYFFKIYRLDKNGKPKRVTVKGISYDKDNNPIEHIIGYRDWERSEGDYSTPEEAYKMGIKYCLENLI